MSVGYIGYDPGSPATMVLIDPNGRWVAHAGEDKLAAQVGNKWTNMPEAFVHYVKLWKEQAKFPIRAVVENVGPMPGEGIVSAAKFAGSVWMARTGFAALDVPYTMVVPTKWKKHFRLDKEKEKSRMLAMQRFPNKVGYMKRKKDHNVAEAALLGLYGWEHKL